MLPDETSIEGYQVDLMTETANRVWRVFKNQCYKDHCGSYFSKYSNSSDFSDYLWLRFYQDHNGLDIPKSSSMVKFLSEEDYTAFVLRWS